MPHTRPWDFKAKDALLASGLSRVVLQAAESGIYLGAAVLQGMGVPDSDRETLVADLRREDYAIIRSGRSDFVGCAERSDAHQSRPMRFVSLTTSYGTYRGQGRVGQPRGFRCQPVQVVDREFPVQQPLRLCACGGPGFGAEGRDGVRAAERGCHAGGVLLIRQTDWQEWYHELVRTSDGLFSR